MFFGGCFLCMASTWSKRQLSIENFSEVTDHIQRIISRTPSKIFSFWLSLEPQTTQMLGPVSPASPDSECAPPAASPHPHTHSHAGQNFASAPYCKLHSSHSSAL